MKLGRFLVYCILIISVSITSNNSLGNALSQNSEKELVGVEIETFSSASDIHINEVMFYPQDGEYEWVELKNIGTTAVNISGWGLTDEDGNWYKFPTSLPAVPGGDFVVVVFDGAGSANDDYDFDDHSIILHSESGIVDIFEDEVDQVSVYMVSEFVYLPLVNNDGSTVTVSQDHVLAPTLPLVSFVAWGDDPGLDATNAILAESWAEGMYKDLSVIGETASIDLIPGQSLGLLPGSQTYFVDRWTYYRTSSPTKGSENPVPDIALYDPVDGATIDSETFAIGWQAVDGAIEYKFQMDNNDDFSSPEYDLTLEGQAFIADTPVPEGTYYWRVKVLINGVEGTWSPGVEINSIAYPASNVLAQESAENVIGVGWQLQRKDTNMICLRGDSEFSDSSWDLPHPESGTPKTHGSNYCERASVSMLASFYGGQLSQERIAYNDYQDTENDLGHGLTNQNINTTLNWAGIPVTRHAGKPSFSTIMSWIDASRPLISLRPGHFRVVDGYREFQSGEQTIQQIHLLDPWNNARWVNYSDDATTVVWVGPAGSGGAPDVRSDEDEDSDGIRDTLDDSDNDGLVDFDERHRFNTDPNKSDSDNDGVPDKLDIREYVFHPTTGVWYLRRADWDGDGVRKELDPDNDKLNNDGARDGCEDSNRNGIFEPELSESSNFDSRFENPCVSLSSNYLGVWQGQGVQINPSAQWSILFGITGGPLDTIVGTTAYPSLSCGGEVTLTSVSANSIELSEDITYGALDQGGNCYDNGIVTLSVSGDTMTYSWRSNSVPATAEGSMTRLSDDGTTLPPDFIGVWSGQGYQYNIGKYWTILFGLANSSTGSIVGTSAYPSLRCGGDLVLMSATPLAIQLREDITYGYCVDNGIVNLTPSDLDTLDYEWFYSNGTLGASGTINRISFPPNAH